jgi:hypothetical protein
VPAFILRTKPPRPELVGQVVELHRAQQRGDALLDQRRQQPADDDDDREADDLRDRGEEHGQGCGQRRHHR